VITKEYSHQPFSFREDGLDLRGGMRSGDHVDIMGNHEMLTDLLNVVTGWKELEERITSDIREISEGVKLIEKPRMVMPPLKG
jgi:phospholipid:diacylglycerol acyltransferase